MACPFFLSYRKKNYTYRLHFDYKSCISFTKRAFRLQKLRFVYKYILVILQTCISIYKAAPRFTIDHLFLNCNTSIFHIIAFVKHFTIHFSSICYIFYIIYKNGYYVPSTQSFSLFDILSNYINNTSTEFFFALFTVYKSLFIFQFNKYLFLLAIIYRLNFSEIIDCKYSRQSHGLPAI